jgi:hypothetical protein
MGVCQHGRLPTWASANMGVCQHGRLPTWASANMGFNILERLLELAPQILVCDFVMEDDFACFDDVA